ncbi:leucine-rich repeat domain-containing protein [Thalassomonas haliotis]|uniref:Uncharacterized protein n=1 Tax=Thalassomonas haliotis TaxID=485448 RepID=A0ABY7VIA7_9GAMM|nr:leucine-rich repeat domain-containing protein [Thalassomonas haliotis]WDE13291.1 hypothetical protein H3N35_07580 [Thalassomonas haliotis]
MLLKNVFLLTSIPLIISCGGSNTDPNDDIIPVVTPPSLVNSPPEVNVTTNIEITQPGSVNLDVTASDDGSITGYHWQQVSGPDVHIEAADSANASFIMPPHLRDEHLPEQSEFIFVVSVTDNNDAITQATININNAIPGKLTDYLNKNDLPKCLTEELLSQWQTVSDITELPCNVYKESDLSWFTHLQSLTIDLLDNIEVALPPLNNLPALKSLKLTCEDSCSWYGDYNGTRHYQGTLEDLNFLPQDHSLEHLEIEYFTIESSAALTTQSQLKTLKFTNSPITDISSLAQLNHLESLVLDTSLTFELAPLHQLPQLKMLTLACNGRCKRTYPGYVLDHYKYVPYAVPGNIKDASPLAELNNLEILVLENSGIEDLSFVKTLDNLTELTLIEEGHIEAGSAIAQLSQLKKLEINNAVSSDSFVLTQLKNLQSLSLSNTNVRDISFIKQMTQLNSLQLGKNLATDYSPLISTNFPLLAELSIDDLLHSCSQADEINGLYAQTLNKNVTCLESLAPDYNKFNNRRLIDKVIREQVSDLASVTELNLYGVIDDFSGIEQFHNLESITFSVPQMKGGILWNALTTDFSALRLLPKLKSLTLENALQAGAQLPPQITSLTLTYPESILPLQNLTELEHLTISGGIEEYTGQTLNFSEENIVLGQLTKLKNLELSLRDLEDMTFISSLSQLESLSLDGKTGSLSALENLFKLTTLNIAGLTDGDYSFLINMPQLEHLRLPSDKLTNLEALQSLLKLKTLQLKHQSTVIENWELGTSILADISRLTQLISLEELELIASYKLADLPSLEALPQLSKLTLNSSGITTFTPQTGFENLTSLNLAGNAITTFNPQTGFNNLTSLNLAGNAITTFNPQTGFNNLTSLSLTGNAITTFNPQMPLNKLTTLYLGRNALTEYQPENPPKNLVILSLTDNDLTSLHYFITLDIAESKLESLNLSWNNDLPCQQVEALTSHISQSNIQVDFPWRCQP